MNLLTEAMNGLGAVLLPVAAGLLFEELTFGGLVRLLLAPWPGTGRRGTRRQVFVAGVQTGSATSKKEKENDRIEAVVDGCGSPVAGCRVGNSTVWTLAAHSGCAPQGRRTKRVTRPMNPKRSHWRGSVALALVACLPLLVAASIVVVPSGMGGVRVSQIGGTLPGTLYPGVHFVTPLVESVQTLRPARSPLHRGHRGRRRKGRGPEDRPERAVARRPQHRPGRHGALSARSQQARQRAGAHAPARRTRNWCRRWWPAHGASWRRSTPCARSSRTKREEVRSKAAAIITRKLGADGIVVEEVMLSDIQLPEEYAKGLEGLLLKEQEDDQMGVVTDIQQKQVKIAELQAEAEAVQKVKEAEGEAQSKVVEAKGEADAMQYTLPLKQKQIEQSKLEAEARKEATIQNAEADAQAKVIDSKAELAAAQPAGRRRGQPRRADGRGQRRAHDQRSGAAEQVAAADQQDHRRAALRQDPGGDGAVGRQVLLRQRTTVNRQASSRRAARTGSGATLARPTCRPPMARSVGSTPPYTKRRPNS